MNQLIQWLETYQIFLYSGAVTIALICAWVSNSKLRYKLWQAHQENHEIKKDYDELLTDNSKLIEALSKKNGL